MQSFVLSTPRCPAVGVSCVCCMSFFRYTLGTTRQKCPALPSGGTHSCHITASNNLGRSHCPQSVFASADILSATATAVADMTHWDFSIVRLHSNAIFRSCGQPSWCTSQFLEANVLSDLLNSSGYFVRFFVHFSFLSLMVYVSISSSQRAV